MYSENDTDNDNYIDFDKYYLNRHKYSNSEEVAIPRSYPIYNNEIW